MQNKAHSVFSKLGLVSELDQGVDLEQDARSAVFTQTEEADAVTRWRSRAWKTSLLLHETMGLSAILS